MFCIIFRSAPEEGLYCKPKYRANLLKYILLVLAILVFVTSAVRISLPSVFWPYVTHKAVAQSFHTHKIVISFYSSGLAFGADIIIKFVYCLLKVTITG